LERCRREGNGTKGRRKRDGEVLPKESSEVKGEETRLSFIEKGHVSREGRCDYFKEKRVHESEGGGGCGG